MTKPSITKRSVKGAALTYNELDDNFQNLKDATVTITGGSTAVTADLNGNITLVAGSNVTITGDNTAKTITINSAAAGLTDIVQDTSPQLGGDLDVNGYKLVTTSNGNIVLDPNGTGNIQIIADDIVVGNGSSLDQISIRPASGKILNLGKPLVDNAWIQLEHSTGHIDVWCDNTAGMTIGSGPVSLVGYGGSAYLTTSTNSTKLYLKTNGTSGSAEIVLNAGTNADVVIVANGTGKVYSNSEFVANTTLTANTKITVPSAGTVTSNSATDKYLSIGAKGQLFDDGNFHIHTSSGNLWLNSLDGGEIRLGTQTNSNSSNVIVNTSTVGHSFFTKTQTTHNAAFGTEVTMDNLKVKINGTGGSGGLVQAGAVSGSFAAYSTLLSNVAGYAIQGDTNSGGRTYTTTYSNISGGTQTLSAGGDMVVIHLVDTTNGKIYRITAIHGQSTTGGYIAIERMA